MATVWTVELKGERRERRRLVGGATAERGLVVCGRGLCVLSPRLLLSCSCAVIVHGKCGEGSNRKANQY